MGGRVGKNDNVRNLRWKKRRRYDWVNGQYVSREDDAKEEKVEFVVSCLVEQGFVADGRRKSAVATVTLTPRGYARNAEIERNSVNGKSVFVATID